MSVILKLGTGRNADRNLRINVQQEEAGKKGNPGFLNEMKDGQALPGHRIHLFLNEHGTDRWFTITGPLRRTDEQGNFITQSRTNEQGQFLDKKGQVVENEAQAAQTFQYHRNRNDEIVYGTLGTLNIKNANKEGQPYRQTLGNLKIYSDLEALNIERKLYQVKTTENPEGKAMYQEQLKQMRADMGTWENLFINDGAEFLRSLGFEVRVPDRSPEPQ